MVLYARLIGYIHRYVRVSIVVVVVFVGTHIVFFLSISIVQRAFSSAALTTTTKEPSIVKISHLYEMKSILFVIVLLELNAPIELNFIVFFICCFFPLNSILNDLLLFRAIFFRSCVCVFFFWFLTCALCDDR